MTASRPVPDMVAKQGIKQQFEREKKETKLFYAVKSPIPQSNRHVGVVMRRYATIYAAGWSLDPGKDDMTWCNNPEPRSRGARV